MQEVKSLFFKLSFVLFLYSLTRLVFLFLNPVFIEQGFLSILNAFWVGTWYDVSATIYSNAVVIILSFISLFKTYKYIRILERYFFIIINSLFLFLNLLDSAYFKFSGKRSGVDILSESADWLPLLGSYFIDYYYILLLLIPIPISLNLIWQKFQHQNNILKEINYVLKSGLSILIILILFLGARGGWGLTPLTTFDASKFAGPNLIPLTINTGFNMIMTVQQQGLSERNYFKEQELSNYFNPIHTIQSKSQYPKNIVLIVVESLGKEYIGFYRKGKSKTPFIDSLMELSTVYNHAYANGKRSIEGLPSIIASMPSLMNTDYPSSYYQANVLHGIGYYLQNNNYEASFYHGGRNGTMSFDNIVASTSNGEYFGLNEYPNPADFDGSWGIYDDKYLSYWANELNKMNEPFFSGIFTLSSHHPYPIPEDLKSQFKEGTLPIHKSISYVDYSLKMFFEKVKQESWFKNSVFIIVADHAAENETVYYQTNQGKFEIPLIIYNPEKPFFNQIDKTVSQNDVMSLALECSSFKGNIFGFGTYPEDSFAVQFHDGYYQMIQYPYVLHFDGNEVLAFYDLSNDLFMNNNLKNSSEIKGRMLNKLKAYLQQYSNCLIRNKTHIY